VAVFGFLLPGFLFSQVITEFTVPTGSSFPLGIAAGPDGALWFTENSANKIGRITTPVVVPPPGAAVPTLSQPMLGLLALALGAAGLLLVKKSS